MLKQVEILEIGEEVPSLKEIAELDEIERLSTDNYVCVEPLALTHADHKGRSIFPVYKDRIALGND